jgi:hypothetical protein
MPTVYKGRGQKYCGSAANFFSVILSNYRYYHPADASSSLNIVLSPAICPNFFAQVAW